jgi:tRNA G18 (ribose-2'-O)-methylase SpoU
MDADPFRSLRASAPPLGHFIGEGPRVVRRMLERGVVVRLMLTPEWFERLAPLIPKDVAVDVRGRREMEEIVGFRLHQGVIALGRIPPKPPLPDTVRGIVVAVDGIANSENLGGILRTCAAFGIEAVLVGRGTCSPWLRRVVRASMGAPLVLPVHECADLAGTIRRLGVPALAAEPEAGAMPLYEADLSPPRIIVFGSEGFGISPAVRAVCAGTIAIPMAAGWDCINVAAAAAAILYQATVPRHAAR